MTASPLKSMLIELFLLALRSFSGVAKVSAQSRCWRFRTGSLLEALEWRNELRHSGVANRAAAGGDPRERFIVGTLQWTGTSTKRIRTLQQVELVSAGSALVSGSLVSGS